MNYKIITKTITLFLLCNTICYSQIPTLVISEVKVNNQPITNNTIDFGDSESVTVNFKVQFTKPENLTIGEVSYVAGTYKYNGWSQLFSPQYFTLGLNNVGFTDYRQYVLYASDYYVNDTNNYLIASVVKTTENVQYESNKIYIKRNPKFTLTSNTNNVTCGTTTPVIFTVQNVDNVGVTYNWNIGSGWLLPNGNPSPSTISTTSNNLSLTPLSHPLSSVSVTPVYNGVNLPPKSKTVTLTPFSAGALSISGSDSVCDTGIYTINNLPNDITIQSVNSSNPNIATANLNTNNEIVVTKVSDGLVTISAILQNSCLQTVPITTTIQSGIPASVNNAVITGESAICDFQQYTYTLSGTSHPCVGTPIWSISSNLIQIASDANSITVVRNASSTQHAGLISVSIPNSTITIEKGVWVGVPDSAGFDIVKIGAYQLYVAQWTKLKADYTPIMYEANEPLNLTFEWQIPYSQVRSFPDTAYKDVKPNFAGQLNIGVRALCDCGYTNWKYKLFNVIDDGNGGGHVIKPAD